jgi:hypothetical protein
MVHLLTIDGLVVLPLTAEKTSHWLPIPSLNGEEPYFGTKGPTTDLHLQQGKRCNEIQASSNYAKRHQ